MAWIDDSIFSYKGNDLVVMLYLVTHMDDKGVCVAGQRTIAKEAGITYASVREALGRLERCGSIVVNQPTAQFTAHFTAHPPTSVTVCNFESYTKQPRKQQRTLQRTLQRTPAVEKLPLEERRKQFYTELIPYVDKQGGVYPAPMVRAFYDYWSEPNPTKTKMLFELKKTWSTAGRLATWARKENIYIKDNNIFDNNILDNNNNMGKNGSKDKEGWQS